MDNSNAWQKRPLELANLFNPAYLAILINKISEGYKTQSSYNLPYAVTFLAIPLIIFPSYSQLLPRTPATKLHAWLAENQEILYEFPELASSVSPYVREAILFGILHDLFELSESQGIYFKKTNIKKIEKDQKNIDVLKKAVLVGKLLGQVNHTQSLFSIFGVRP